MALTADFILNHNPTVKQQPTLNGTNKQLEFVSAGYCQFDDTPEGCIVFNKKVPLSRPPLKLRVEVASTSRTKAESPSPIQKRPTTNGIEQRAETPRPAQPKPLSNGTSQHVDTPKSTQSRPLSNGTSQHVDTPRPAQKRPFFNDQQDEAPVQKRPLSNGNHIDTPRPSQKRTLPIDQTNEVEKPEQNGHNGTDQHFAAPRTVQKESSSNEKRLLKQDVEPSVSTLKKVQLNGNNSRQEAPKVLKRTYDQLDEDRLAFNWKGLDIARMTKHGAGFNNHRNDCFINSVLQFVFHTPQLLRHITSKKNKHNCLDETRCIYCVLYRYYRNICNNQTAFSVIRLRDIVNSQFPNRIPNNQEDAHEMLIFLLSKLEPPFPKRNNLTPSEPRLKPTPTEIDRIFGGKLMYRTTCNECQHKQITSEDFRELNIDLSSSMNQLQTRYLDELIAVYFKNEFLNDYKCDKCSRKNSSRALRIEEPPNILVIQLKRFRYTGAKDHTEVVFPLDLDLSKHVLRKHPELKYRLYGFISHLGASARSGHYTATMSGYNEKWYRFDDDDVTETNPSRFDHRQPYLLFYHRISSVSRPSQTLGVFSSNKNPISKPQTYQWNSAPGIKRPLVDKQNTQNGNSQRNGYHQTNGTSYQSVFKKPNSNGYSNGDSQKWNNSNGYHSNGNSSNGHYSNGHHSNGNHSMNGNKSGMSFSYEKFHPPRN